MDARPPADQLLILLGLAMHRLNPDPRATVEIRLDPADDATLDLLMQRGMVIEGGGPDHILSARLVPRAEGKAAVAAFVAEEGATVVIKEPGITMAAVVPLVETGAMGHHGPDDYRDCREPRHWDSLRQAARTDA